ncbi:PadR family transcriptional regulator [Dietzia sp.]|uniref:PadR family transcriptional regulator n=1 Tax=Dietzia sp. TaxID=1871616 RepID=UPI002FD9020D
MANSFGNGGHGAPGGPGARGGRGPRGRGGFGQGFGPGPGFGGGFGSGFGAGFGTGGPGRGDGKRRARRGDVRNGILLLLAEESRNGYGVMRELAERSEGEWTPSSGAVYPALSQLEDEGLIELDAEAGPKHYRLTVAGSAEAEALAEKRAPWDLGESDSVQAGDVSDGADDVNGPGRPGLELGNSMRQMMLALRSVLATGDERLIAQAREEIDGLRKSLYAMLAEND